MFDMGGTLEDLYSDQENERRTAHALYSILQKHGIETPYGEEALWERVYPQILAYKAESERTMMELKPEEIWPDYGFAGIPVDREKLIAASEEIAHMWEVTYFNRALLRTEIGDYNRALEDYDNVTLYSPGNVMVYYNRAGLYARLGDFRAAEADYDRPRPARVLRILSPGRLRRDIFFFSDFPHFGPGHFFCQFRRQSLAVPLFPQLEVHGIYPFYIVLVAGVERFAHDFPGGDIISAKANLAGDLLRYLLFFFSGSV